MEDRNLAIDVDNVTVRFGSTIAVNTVSMHIKPGELFGLIGPDGAGKTSLLRVLVTLLLPESGSATVDGLDVVRDYKKLRRRLGYMPGRFSLYHDLSVRENLEFFATIFGTTVDANYDLIENIYKQLEPFESRKAGALSGGMKQKLALSCSLIHRPRVLILDEPTTGVDAVSRQEFWDMLKILRQEGITILVSTPYMDEARMCDRVALIQNGRILRTETPEAVEQSFPHLLFGIRHERMYELLKRLRAESDTHSIYAFGDSLHYTSTMMDLSERDVAAKVAGLGFTDASVNSIKANIEDVFMDLMQESET